MTKVENFSVKLICDRNCDCCGGKVSHDYYTSIGELLAYYADGLVNTRYINGIYYAIVRQVAEDRYGINAAIYLHRGREYQVTDDDDEARMCVAHRDDWLRASADVEDLYFRSHSPYRWTGRLLRVRERE